MKNIREIKHPLVKHYITNIRDITIPANLFRENISYLANILFYEAIREFKTIDRRVETWIGEGEYPSIDEESFIFIPILRAGLPMLEGILKTLPNVVSGFLAMKRDEESLEPHIFYNRIPNIEEKIVFLLDPMVATGGSLIDAIDLIKKRKPKKIISLNLIASPFGLEKVAKRYPNVEIYIAQIDKKLNDKGFIMPGIGDAGDRAYNTI